MREMQALKAFGIEVRGFAARRSGDAHVEEALLESDQKWTFARPDNVWPHLAGNLKNLLLHPRRYLATLGVFLRQAGNMSPPGFVRLLYHFFCGIGFGERLRREGIRHVHCHFSTGSNMALAAHLFAGISFSFTAHASGDIFVRPVLIEEKVKGAKFVVAVCEYSRKYLDAITRYRYSPKIHRIYNGVETGEAERLLRRPGRAQAAQRKDRNGAWRVVSVGRLIGCKGFATLLKALRILEKRGKAVACRIIGEGAEQETLDGLIRQWGLSDRVSLTGSLPLHRVYEALREADLFVLLSEIQEDGLRDGFPTVILEAMAMSLPVVATRISGIPEMVVHEQTGLLVEERDAEGAAGAIERLIGAREWAARLGEAGRRRVAEKFALENSMTEFVDLLRKHLPSVPGGQRGFSS